MGRSGNCRIANARTSLRGVFVLGMGAERIGRPRLTLISGKERVRGGSESCFMMLLCDQTAPSSGNGEQCHMWTEPLTPFGMETAAV